MSNSDNEKKAVKTAYFSIFSGVILTIIKWSAGHYGHSYALIADAIESTADILSSIILCIGIQYANRPKNDRYPYGYGKIETLVTFISVGFLFTSAVIIGYNSIVNILTPHEEPEVFTLYVLGVIIVWKEISFRIIRRNALKTNSSSLKADAWHHRSDAITSLAAFVGISAGIISGRGNIDDWAALFASFIILFNAYLIFKPALGEIMDINSYDNIISSVRDIALTVAGVENTEKCFIRKSGMRYHVDLHVWVDGNITVTQGHSIAHNLQNTLLKKMPHLGHVLIHIEPNKETD